MNTTILNTPLAQLRQLVSARTLHLLTRNGFTEIPDVRLALGLGTLGDIRGLGPVALMEIRLALDSLPADETPPALPALPESAVAPALTERELSGLTERELSGLTERELRIILTLAEASTTRLPPQYTVNEAEVALSRLREIVRPQPYTADVEPGGRIIIKDATGTPLPRSKSRGEEPELPYRPPARREPEPVDDDFEGYVIDPKPGWGQP
jgi:hypothetical protein